MEQGWIKFYREWLDNPIITKDAEHLAVWLYLNCSAVHNEVECIFKNEKIILNAGQMILKQNDMAEQLKIDRFKVMRIIKCFENAHLITHSTDKRKTLITLEHWAVYQGLNTQANALSMHIQCTSEKETENEKEKRSKREKDKEKEINKNERMKEYIYPPISPQGEKGDGIFLSPENSIFSFDKEIVCFPQTDNDLDSWLEEDDGIDDWDKVQLYYKQLHSSQQSAASSQQDSYMENNETNDFIYTNPIQQKNKEIYIPQPQTPSPFAEGEHLMSGKHHSARGGTSPFLNGDTPPSPVTALFDEFWKAYPKKVGKGYAFECFKKIKPSRKLLDTMLEAIAKQKKSDMWKRDKGQYIPNPSTWLNQKRWEDDLDGETDDNPFRDFKLGLEF